MKDLLLKLEPLIWLMFGQGILLGTVLLTGWVLVVGLGVPLPRWEAFSGGGNVLQRCMPPLSVVFSGSIPSPLY